jgi:hypothetical protein
MVWHSLSAFLHGPGQPDSGLDHIYSNKTEKLSEVYAEFVGGSDHKLIKVTRYSKSLKKNVRYVRKRVYKHFKDEEFCQYTNYPGGIFILVKMQVMLPSC